VPLTITDYFLCLSLIGVAVLSLLSCCLVHATPQSWLQSVLSPSTHRFLLSHPSYCYESPQYCRTSLCIIVLASLHPHYLVLSCIVVLIIAHSHFSILSMEPSFYLHTRRYPVSVGTLAPASFTEIHITRFLYKLACGCGICGCSTCSET
jgi:hypothetical protein